MEQEHKLVTHKKSTHKQMSSPWIDSIHCYWVLLNLTSATQKEQQVRSLILNAFNFSIALLNLYFFVSGLASIAKVILASENLCLPPNLHYQTPNPKIPSLVDGRLKVVNEITPWKGGLVAVNSYGFGGANVHAILKSNTNGHSGQEDSSQRIFLCSARTEESWESICTLVLKHPKNIHLQALLDCQVNQPTRSHPVRGYALINGPDIKESKV